MKKLFGSRKNKKDKPTNDPTVDISPIYSSSSTPSLDSTTLVDIINDENQTINNNSHQIILDNKQINNLIDNQLKENQQLSSFKISSSSIQLNDFLSSSSTHEHYVFIIDTTCHSFIFQIIRHCIISFLHGKYQSSWLQYHTTNVNESAILNRKISITIFVINENNNCQLVWNKIVKVNSLNILQLNELCEFIKNLKYNFVLDGNNNILNLNNLCDWLETNVTNQSNEQFHIIWTMIDYYNKLTTTETLQRLLKFKNPSIVFDFLTFSSQLKFGQYLQQPLNNEIVLPSLTSPSLRNLQEMISIQNVFHLLKCFEFVIGIDKQLPSLMENKLWKQFELVAMKCFHCFGTNLKLRPLYTTSSSNLMDTLDILKSYIQEM
ncbi:hypothetical protein ABK040_005703 [Willaertia magna]